MKNNNLLCTNTIINKKAWWLYTLFLILLVSLFHPQAYLQVQAAEGDIPINEAHFPDENFRLYLRSQSYGSDAILSVAEIPEVKSINVAKKEISSLEGIEYFTSLTELYCYQNQLTSLDISKNTALTSLECENNQLTSLDISKNTALTSLMCYNNPLTSLDISKNTALTKLYCGNNQLTSLDISKNTALTELYCYHNQLTSLDISKNTALEILYCGNNPLTSLDISKNTALTELYCYQNQLTSLDISKNTALTELYCYQNQLTSLDISKNTALTELYCYQNQLTSLDISKNTALTSLECENNQLTSLDISKNTTLQFLVCFENQLTSLDISKNTALTYLDCGNNPLTSLDISKNTALTKLYCYQNQLTSLDISKNTALEFLDCSNNQYVQNTNAKNQIDVADLPGNFDMNKAKSWNGADKNENNFITATAGSITYTYECSNDTSASFTLIPAFPVSYQLNGGANHQNNPVNYTATDAFNLQAPTRTGYTFAGWYRDASFKTKVTSIKKGSFGSQTLYARWTPKEYTVTFHAQKGTVTPKSKKVTYGIQYGSLPTPKRTGYSFQGWYTKSSGGSKITSSKKVTITKGQTLYAKWTPKQYTLKFNAGKGKVSQKTKKITYDAKYGSLPNPKRAGYSFQGWYTKSSGGSKITSSKKVTVTKGQTLHARWKKVSVAKVSIRSIKNSSSKKAVLSLKKVSGASGYQVVYADNKNFKKAQKTDVSGTKVTLKKLTKGKTWHVKVKAYKKDSAGKKVYGKYSSVKKIKIKK